MTMWVVECKCKGCGQTFEHRQLDGRGMLPSRCPACSKERRRAQNRAYYKTNKRKRRAALPPAPTPGPVEPNTPEANRARIARDL